MAGRADGADLSAPVGKLTTASRSRCAFRVHVLKPDFPTNSSAIGRSPLPWIISIASATAEFTGDPGLIRTSDLQLRRKSRSRHSPSAPKCPSGARVGPCGGQGRVFRLAACSSRLLTVKLWHSSLRLTCRDVPERRTRTRKATDDDGTHPRAAQRGRGAL
jgi:hypothetical protein